jgi:hypothetical protein
MDGRLGSFYLVAPDPLWGTRKGGAASSSSAAGIFPFSEEPEEAVRLAYARLEYDRAQMKQTEYEQSKRRLEEQRRAGVELVERA